MNKRILISLSVIAVVSVIAIGGTIAYFSDAETSVGNTFTAGELDIKIDNTCHYNGNVCALFDPDGEGNLQEGYYWQGNSSYPEPNTPCSCTWVKKDLSGELFFNFDDIKPGDHGESTISLHAAANDSYVCIKVGNIERKENGCNEAEKTDEPGCENDDFGELQRHVYLKIWRDSGVGEPGAISGKCDNAYQDGEKILVEDIVIDNNKGEWPLYDYNSGALKSNTEECIGIEWSVPGKTGNIIQGDSVKADISFYAEQARNNDGFICPSLRQPTAE